MDNAEKVIDETGAAYDVGYRDGLQAALAVYAVNPDQFTHNLRKLLDKASQ